MGAPRFPTSYTANGTTKSYALGFPIIKEAHIRVVVNGVLKARGTDYNVQDPTSKNPTIAFATAPTDTHTIKFYRNTPLAPPTSEGLVIGQTLELYAQYRAEELADQRVRLDWYCNDTDLAAGTAQSLVAPCDGYIEMNEGVVVNAAIGTGGSITTEVEGVAVTGLTLTFADAAAIGTVKQGTPTTAQSSTTKVRRGQVITVTPGAAFATTGAVKGALFIQPADLD